MIERGDVKIMAIDSTKFEKSAFAKVMDTEGIDVIITDRKPQKAVLKSCEEKGIKCIYSENKRSFFYINMNTINNLKEYQEDKENENFRRKCSSRGH